jgi:hypothetical protein
MRRHGAEKGDRRGGKVEERGCDVERGEGRAKK